MRGMMTTHSLAPQQLTGLTDSEVNARLARGQRNVQPPKSARSTWDIIRDNVFTIFNIILFVTLAGTLAVGLSGPTTRQTVVGDTLFSGATVWLNLIVGVIQELRAKAQLDKLAALAVRNARVRRNGQSVETPVDQIVLDDLVELGPGDRVPVDGEVVEGHALEMDESLLTGESDSITKKPGDAVMSGSFCMAGSALIRADKVGAESYANKLTATARKVKDTRTPLQRKIDFVVQGLVIIMAVIAILQLIAATNTRETPLQALRFTLVIVTSFVPAGLILAITVSLSVGAVRISQYKTLVQRINAIESMGNVTVLCADKTGTLTRNLLAVQEVVPLGEANEFAVKELLAQYVAGLNSLNKTASAIGEYCGKPALARSVQAEVAFSSARKWSALGFTDGEALILGSPEIIFAGLPEIATILSQSARFTHQGLRVVAFLKTTDPMVTNPETGETKLTVTALQTRIPVALVVIRDEIRTDIQETLNQFAELGVRVKVISGDNVETVQAIARRAGLQGDHVISEADLVHLSESQFAAAVKTAELFGRITPDMKQRIVQALTQQGEYVAMVGDGVNDVPALKQARLGIAMNDGAQIAKDVSEMVLLENTMSTLPRALKEGQSITQKIYASAKLYLAKNVITIIAILFAGFVRLPFPGEPRHISWIATITVGIPCTLLAFGILRPAYTRRFIDNVLGYSLIVGSVGAIVLVAVYIISDFMGVNAMQSRAAFALANMHFAMHVYWDVMDVSVFSLSSIRKHPREFWVGVGLLIVGLLTPMIIPGMFDSTLPLPEQWASIIFLPLIGACLMRVILYGTFMHGMMKALRA